MFSRIKRAYTFSGVQAELKAQCGDQVFVERVCQGPEGASYTNARLDRWRDITKTIPQSKVRFFVIACGVLGDRLMHQDLDQADLDRCANLLSDRCKRISSSLEMLMFCETSLPIWLELIDAQNNGKGNSSSQSKTEEGYIECYLMWFTTKDDKRPSYISISKDIEGLRKDYSAFFCEILETKKQELTKLPARRPPSETRRTDDGISIPITDLLRNGHEHDIRLATNCLNNLDWIEMYLSGSKEESFINIASMEVWIDKGMRPRQKFRGSYVD